MEGPGHVGYLVARLLPTLHYLPAGRQAWPAEGGSLSLARPPWPVQPSGHNPPQMSREKGKSL